MFIIMLCFANVKWKLLFSSLSCYLVHDNSKQEKDYALLLSFVGQAQLQFAGLHSLFLALWCTVIEISRVMRDLLFWCIYILGLFAVADDFFATIVSARPWYSPLQMLFFATIVSARPWYSLLQMLFWSPSYLQLAFLWTCRYFSACLLYTIASTSCLFLDLRILPSQILHLHPTFSITWGCFSLKLCILNLLFL